MSGVSKVKSTATTHEWQTQALASADTTNAQLEGDDAITSATTATVRLNNICQISQKTPKVTGTQQVVRKAGREDEMAYQVMLKGLELKRDMEAICLMNQAKASGSDTSARKLASVLSWIKSNTSKGSAGGAADPSAADGTGTRTDGTQRTFTEAQMKAVLQSIWTAGGDPDVIMVAGFNKQQFSSFVGRGTPIEPTKEKKIYASVDIYESDFGTLKVVPNRVNSRQRDCLILQMDMWAVATLRNMRTEDLAKTGDSTSKQIVTEYTVECRNEKASGGVFDLSTS